MLEFEKLSHRLKTKWIENETTGDGLNLDEATLLYQKKLARRRSYTWVSKRVGTIGHKLEKVILPFE